MGMRMANGTVKRFACLILALAMVLPLAVSAADETPEEASPAQEETLPAQEEALPAQEEALPAQEEALPAQEEALPAQEEALPQSESELVSADVDNPESQVSSHEDMSFDNTIDNSINGLIWLDDNGDGLIDNNEQAVADYPVYLYKSDNIETEVASTKTDNNGIYSFSNIENGSYIVGIKQENENIDHTLSAVGIIQGNKFALADDSSMQAFTNAFDIECNTQINDLNGALNNNQIIEDPETSSQEEGDSNTGDVSTEETTKGDNIEEETTEEDSPEEDTTEEDTTEEDSPEEDTTEEDSPEEDTTEEDTTEEEVLKYLSDANDKLILHTDKPVPSTALNLTAKGREILVITAILLVGSFIALRRLMFKLRRHSCIYDQGKGS